MHGYPLTNPDHISDFLQDTTPESAHVSSNGMLSNGPILFHAEFDITASDIYDTYLDVSGWGKGIAYVNGFNLGRYWPAVGPQITLYVPGEILVKGKNEIVMIEIERISPLNKNYVRFTDVAILDGSLDGNAGGNDGSNAVKLVASHFILIAFTAFFYI